MYIRKSVEDHGREFFFGETAKRRTASLDGDFLLIGGSLGSIRKS
jgi:hypothetical protein